MLALDTLRAVWEAFRANRLRFLLTLTGVVIGSASLVLLSGLLAGGKDALLRSSQEAAEDDLIEVRDWSPPEKDRRRTTRPLERGDAEALDTSPLIGGARVTGQRNVRRTVFWKGNKKAVAMVGVPTDALSLYRLQLAKGRSFDEDDVRHRRRVAVVGHKVWTDLLRSPPSLQGVELRTGGERFTVVGVLAHKPAFSDDGLWLWDNRVLLPESTFAVTLPPPSGSRRALGRVFLRLSEARYLADRLSQVRAVVRSTLLRRHHGVENFKIQGDGGDARAEVILSIVSLLVLATAVVSLIVGGINVMNIMLVTVTERTREIGVRRAVGAPRRQLLVQFLAEATITAGLGGVLGVAAGVGLTYVAALILDRVTGGWAFQVVPWAPPLAIAAALSVGMIFGLYPAWRASRLDPVAALRFE